jgi:hypothetical protein
MRGYRRLLGWAAVPILDRRWAAPLSALALGLGLFVGVAIGPGAAGTLATNGVKIVELPGFGGSSEGPTTSVTPQKAPRPAAAKPDAEPAASSPSSFGSSLTPLSVEEPVSPEPLPAGEDEEAEDESPAPEKEPKADEETVTGVVVHLNKAAGSYVVAEKGGFLSAVHAPTAPQAGTEVEVPVRSLANGTFAEAGRRLRLGTEAQAIASGIVTFVEADPAQPGYAVSKRGLSMFVHIHPDPSGAAPALPQLGALATVNVEIEKTSLWQRRLETDGAPLTFAELAGVVGAVDLEARQLLLSADDVRESGHDLVIELPEGDLTPPEIGSSVLATVTIEPDGRLVLRDLTSDEHRKGADSEAFLHLFHMLDTAT